MNFNNSDSRNKLFQLEKLVNHEKPYVVNEIIMKHGHISLHLLPYHPDLNSIKFVWGKMKRKLAHKNIESSSLQQKAQLLRKSFSEYSSLKVLLTRKKD